MSRPDFKALAQPATYRTRAPVKYSPPPAPQADSDERITDGLLDLSTAIESVRPRLPDIAVQVPIRVRNRANGSQGRSLDARKARAAEVEREHMAIHLALAGCRRSKPVAPIIAVLTRFGPATMDRDGNVRALKAVQDAVAAWLGIDDGDEQQLFVLHQQVLEKTYAVKVELYAGAWR